jgi:polyisoprenoid-binding protein YceI
MLRKLPKHIVVIIAVLFVLASTAKVRAQEVTVEVDPAQSSIEFMLGASLHTVHGHFQLKSGTIHFDPAKGTASGIIAADATSADTGNKSRDRKMHTQVLESQKYPDITFSPNKVSGSVALQGSSTVQLEGTFRLHGDDHGMVLTIPVQITGNNVTANTRFTVPYVAWGLRNPSTFLLHVSDKVEVEVSIKGQASK